MHITPDNPVFWRYGFVELNSTIVTTWGFMLVMTVGSWLITRKLATEVHVSRWLKWTPKSRPLNPIS